MSTSTASQKTAEARLHLLQEMADQSHDENLKPQAICLFGLNKDDTRTDFDALLADIAGEIDKDSPELQAALWALGIRTDISERHDRQIALLEHRIGDSYMVEDLLELAQQEISGFKEIVNRYDDLSRVIKLEQRVKELERSKNDILADMNQEVSSQISSIGAKTALRKLLAKHDPDHS